MVQMECMCGLMCECYKKLKGLNRFRWVACQIEELKHCHSQKMFMKTLKSLPKDLKSTYNEIVQRIDEREMPIAKVILQWLVFGMRPLTVEQLAIIVAFDSATGTFDFGLQLTHPDDIIQLCSSLVMQTANKEVQLAHASVKEYFLEKNGLLDPETSHATIAYCCITYMQKSGWNKFGSPLLEYSAECWPNHYNKSDRNTTLRNNVITLFESNEGILSIWRAFCTNHAAIQLDVREGHPVHLAASLGLDDIVEDFVKRNFEGNGAYGKIIEIVTEKGYTSILKNLLDHGVHVNVNFGGYFGNALQAASGRGHTDIAKLLLDKGANVNKQGGNFGNALQAASLCGHAEIAKLLLDKGANVNEQGGRFGNALHAASFCGHAEIAKLLLDKGANVNAKGGECGNALQGASFCGHAEIAKLLLPWTREQM